MEKDWPAQSVRIGWVAGFIDIKMQYFDFFMHSLGFISPRVSTRIARLIYVLDRILISAPGIRYFSSGFAGIAYKGRD